MKPITDLKSFFETKRKVFITTHVRPDADALGSSIALYHFLNLKGHQCTLVLPTSYAGIYKWFPLIEEAGVFEDSVEESKSALQESDIIIVVDFNQLSRNGDLGKLILEENQPKVLIDHHTNPEDVFDYRIWDTKFSAAAEGIFHFIEMIDIDLLMNKTIATCLYAAIIADSGSFRHQGVSSNTHKIASKLLESGINHSEIHRNVYDNFTENRLKLWGYCLNDKLTIMKDHPVAYITLSLKEFEKFGGVAGDTEGLVNFPLAIEGVEISVLIIGKKDQIKLSFRSKTIAVNEFASKYFNGGGHVNASGGECDGNLNAAVKLLVENVPELFK